MPTIAPVSDLRNYASVLTHVHKGSPVYLTRHGRGAYAIVDIDDFEAFERFEAERRLMAEINAGERSFERGNYTLEEIKREFRID